MITRKIISLTFILLFFALKIHAETYQSNQTTSRNKRFLWIFALTCLFGGCTNNEQIPQENPSIQTYSNGKIRWKENCDFNGDDIQYVSSFKDECGDLCEDHPECNYFTWISNTCYLKSKTKNQIPSYLSNSICGWIDGKNKLAKLINYWPMSSLKDIIGGANLYGGLNYEFTYDRFNNPKSALSLNQGFVQVPSGYYFTGDFTVTVWIKIKSYQFWSRIIDFGDGFPLDNVIITMNRLTSQLCVAIRDGTITQELNSPSIIQLGYWYHVAYVLKENIGYLYIDGKLVTSGYQRVNKKWRRYNYIGKSFSNTDSYADAVYDELKIYEGVLSDYEIQTEAYASSLCKNTYIRDELRKRRAFDSYQCFLNELVIRPQGVNSMVPSYSNPIVEVRRNPVNNRVEWLMARIYRRHLNTGSSTNSATRSYSRLMGINGDQAGHIVANILGGTGRDTYNIFPQNANLNMGAWRVVERNIYEFISRLRNDNEYLEATYSLRYNSPTDTRPIYVVVKLVWSNGYEQEFIDMEVLENIKYL